MKILYLTARGVFKRSDSDEHDDIILDMEHVSKEIKKGIKDNFDDIEIDLPLDIIRDDGIIPDEILGSYDLCICDLTKKNQSVYYTVGLLEGMGKPIIYFASNAESLLPVFNQKVHLLYSEVSLTSEFRLELNQQIKLVRKDPKKFKTIVKPVKIKPKAFISYSHADKEYLNRLLAHLKPLEKKGLIDVWQDTKIKSGDKWEDKVNKALREANIAVLMISADFMASDFIVDNELPPLLTQAEVKGTRIVPIIISHCRFSREPNFNGFQAVNSPAEPLSMMSDDEKESVYDKLANDIESAIESSNN